MGLFAATVRLGFAAGSGAGTNTWHLRTVSENGTTAEVATLMGLVRSFYEACEDIWPTSYTASWDGTVRQVATLTPGVLGTASPWSVSGQVVGGYGPAATGVCVTWRTSLATRSGRGRTFLSPVAGATLEGENGTLTNSSITVIRNAAASLVAASEAASVTGALGVFSQKQGVFRDFIGSSVTDQYAVLRSRRS